MLRHSLFTKNLVERLPSPLLPGLWRDLMSDAPAVGHRIGYLAEDWLQWAERQAHAADAAGAGAPSLLFFGLRYSIGRITDRRHLRTEPPPPSFFERAKSAAWVAPLRALPAIAAGVLLYGGLDALDLLFPPWGRAAGAVLKAIIVFSALSALIYRRARPALAAVAPGVARRRADAPRRRAAVRHHRRLRHRRGADRDQPRVLRAAGAQRRAVVRGQHGLRRPADRPAADALHAASGRCAGRPPMPRRRMRQRRAARLAPRAALAQAAAVADRARHPRLCRARLRRAGALHRPAAGDDRHRRRRRLAALSRHPRGDARAAAAALSRSARCSRRASASMRRAATSWRG